MRTAQKSLNQQILFDNLEHNPIRINLMMGISMLEHSRKLMTHHRQIGRRIEKEFRS